MSQLLEKLHSEQCKREKENECTHWQHYCNTAKTLTSLTIPNKHTDNPSTKVLDKSHQGKEKKVQRLNVIKIKQSKHTSPQWKSALD